MAQTLRVVHLVETDHLQDMEGMRTVRRDLTLRGPKVPEVEEHLLKPEIVTEVQDLKEEGEDRLEEALVDLRLEEEFLLVGEDLLGVVDPLTGTAAGLVLLQKRADLVTKIDRRGSKRGTEMMIVLDEETIETDLIEIEWTAIVPESLGLAMLTMIEVPRPMQIKNPWAEIL